MVLLVAVVTGLCLSSNTWRALFKFVDFLVPTPGLSGLFLLGLLPLGFVFLVLLVEWVWRGYAGESFGRS